jgi:FkbM family methyltransferase
MKEYKRLHIDIGANEGKAALHYARFEPDTFVIAFEPIPTLVQSIREKSKHLKNIMVIEAAVSNYDGNEILKVSPPSEKYGDFSCSSLLDFSENSKSAWVGRDDFKVIHQIPVKVMRLDNFFIANDISSVNYLKIDTQGHDLNVLKGCGDLLSIIESGEMEAGTKTDILYKGQNTKDECIEFLESHGFEITDIQSNDVHNNEVNIIFKNKNPKIALYTKTYNLYDRW